MNTKAITQYLAKIGSKGGQTKGKTKVRGDKAYYSAIAKKGWASRRTRKDP